MEIITYVREGEITHRDHLNNEGRTRGGDVQVMSAGTGIQHAEWNREDSDTTLFQIWIGPSLGGGEPSWGAKPFPKGDRSGRFVPLASGFASDPEALPIRAEARVLGATLKAGETAKYELAPSRHGYLVPARGSGEVNGVRIGTRDGAASTDEALPAVKALENTDIVLDDTP